MGTSCAGTVCGYLTPALQPFDIGSHRWLSRERDGLWLHTKSASVVLLVLQLPASWTEQLLESLVSSMKMATVNSLASDPAKESLYAFIIYSIYYIYSVPEENS